MMLRRPHSLLLYVGALLIVLQVALILRSWEEQVVIHRGTDGSSSGPAGLHLILTVIALLLAAIGRVISTQPQARPFAAVPLGVALLLLCSSVLALIWR